ncbi:hypothetical protein ACFL0Y_03960 [Patescibacteria group bacterium]
MTPVEISVTQGERSRSVRAEDGVFARAMTPVGEALAVSSTEDQGILEGEEERRGTLRTNFPPGGWHEQSQVFENDPLSFTRRYSDLDAGLIKIQASYLPDLV